ncbi:hypothetical protein GCM10017602_11560 [Herbiconiux flava]|nr:hypothetical protein GCM10017602_11560 [Herbiconiux flava]
MEGLAVPPAVQPLAITERATAAAPAASQRAAREPCDMLNSLDYLIGRVMWGSGAAADGPDRATVSTLNQP